MVVVSIGRVLYVGGCYTGGLWETKFDSVSELITKLEDLVKTYLTSKRPEFIATFSQKIWEDDDPEGISVFVMSEKDGESLKERLKNRVKGLPLSIFVLRVL